MSPPTTHVLSTPELLESILIHLSPPQLLSAHLISRTFHTTILSSPTLQRALFFRTDPNIPPQSWTVNPLLRKHFTPFFVTPGDVTTMPNHLALHMLDWTKTEKTKDAFLRADASWRRMLLVQPAPLKLHVARVVDMRGGSVFNAAEPLCFAGGVTMGIVYDIAESFVGGNASFEKFGLVVSGVESEVEMKLYLERTKQCAAREPGVRTLVSAGAASRCEVAKVKWGKVVKEAREGPTGEIEMVRWRTEVVDWREGVGKYEWADWRRMRSAIGDPMSDVRGG